MDFQVQMKVMTKIFEAKFEARISSDRSMKHGQRRPHANSWLEMPCPSDRCRGPIEVIDRCHMLPVCVVCSSFRWLQGMLCCLEVAFTSSAISSQVARRHHKKHAITTSHATRGKQRSARAPSSPSAFALLESRVSSSPSASALLESRPRPRNSALLE